MSETARPGRLDHIGVQVPDLDAALAFFTGALGLQAVDRGVGPDGVTPVAFVVCEGFELEVFEVPDAPARIDHFGLRVDDTPADAVTELERRDVRRAGDEGDGSRGTRVLRLDAATTAGLPMHLYRAASAAGLSTSPSRDA